MISLDVDLQDLFCEPSPASFSFLFLVWSNVSSEAFRRFCACTSSSSTLDFFQVLLSSISMRSGAIPNVFSSALHFDLYFLTNRLYRSRTNLGVTFKKRSSNEFKISHLFQLETTLFWKKNHHAKQKKIFNSARTFDILIK